MKRQRGSGSVDERGGRYRARIRDPRSGLRVTIGTFETPEEAEGAIAGTLEAIYSSRGKVKGYTLAEVGASFLDWRELVVKVRWPNKERSVWAQHIGSSELAGFLVQEITARDVRDWVRKTSAKRSAQGGQISRQTVVHALKLLRACYKYIIEELEVVHSDPTIGVTVQKDHRPLRKDPDPYLTAQEIELLKSSSTVPFDKKVIFLTAIYTGLRAGEMWGLRWEDVLLDRREIIVRYSYKKAPKSGQVIQRVPLFDSAHALLSLWKQSAFCPLVFPTKTGNMRTPGDDAGWADKRDGKRLIRGYRARAGIKRNITFHQLRATCGTHLVSGTWGRQWSLVEVQQFLRHADFRTTQEHYARFLPGALQDAARATSLGPLWGPDTVIQMAKM